MFGEISMDFDLGTAHDEEGNEVDLSFCLVIWNGQVGEDFVLIDGELHKCSEFRWVMACVRFWVEPANDEIRVIAYEDIPGMLEDSRDE